MSENFSLNDLFAKGMTREEFIAKYGEISNGQNINAKEKSSIFNQSVSGSAGEMFDTLNTDGNDTLDEAELLQFMGQDGNSEDISETDLQGLYRQMAANIMKNYTTTNPQEMFNAANKGVEPESSTYIQDLSSQIEMLNELISLRESNSYQITSELQSQIDEAVSNSTTLSNDFKKNYKKASDKLAKLKKEAAQNNLKIQSNAIELQNAKAESSILEQQISSLDPEQDADLIKSYKDDLKSVNKRLGKLAKEQDNLSSKKASYSSKIKEASAELGYLTSEAQSGDGEIKTKIQSLRVEIDNEKKSCENDVKSYQSQLSILEKAQQYAIEQLPKPGAYESSGVDTSSYHKNDNALSFDELSKNGLKYSGANGQKLAQAVRRGVVGFTGHCSRKVSNALRDSGLGTERAASAHMMDDKLRNNKNFKEVKVNSVEELRSLPAGCVVVYEAGAARYSSKHGHIEITLGNGTAASDGITRNMRYSENMSVFVPVESA